LLSSLNIVNTIIKVFIRKYNFLIMKKYLCFLTLAGIILSGCSGKEKSQVGMELTPYGSTPTPSLQTNPADATATPLPTPSPAPQYHTVQAGETMSSIALLYGLNMNDVVLANPDIDPNAMVVGMQVLIPPKTVSAEAASYSSTPAPVNLTAPECYKERSGGLWCFMVARNDNDSAVENVLVEITLGDANASQLTAQIAAAPLNMIPSKSQLPLSAYFPPPVPEPYRYSYLLISSIPVEDESRYLETQIMDQSVNISEDGLTAQITARVFVNGTVGESVQVWLSAAAFNKDGSIVGVRRIEAVATLDEVGVIVLNGYVYSTATPINSVQLNAEAIYTQ
jgi:LysM repeat protein